MTRRLLLGAVAVALTMGGLSNALAQNYPAYPQVAVPSLAYQAPGTTPFTPEQAPAAPGRAPQAASVTPAPATPSPAASNENDLFSQGSQGDQFAMAAESFAPNMIGDFLAPTFVTVGHFAGTFGYVVDTVASPGGGFGRFKMADDTSPLPQDRVLTDSSYFGGALSANGAGGTTRLGVYGFEAGFEKTFLSGAASIEVRGPFSDVETVGTNFGDMGVALKGLLINRCDLAICAGMSMNVPTAPNFVTSGLEGGSHTITIEDQSVHLLPFVGALWMPSCRFFMQGYVQVDVDASGNEVLGGTTGGPLTSIGRLHDPTFLYVDVGAGYWLRRGDCSRWINGVACIGEIHVNQSVGSGGVIREGTGPLPPAVNYSFVDFVAGAHLDIGQNSNMTIGYVAPLTSGEDRLFNGELRAFYNYRF